VRGDFTGVISRYTIGILVEILADWDKRALRTLLFKYEVPSSIALSEESRQVLALKGMSYLEENLPEKIEEIVKEVASSTMPESNRQKLEKALLRDGYTVFNGKLLSEPIDVGEEKTALEILVTRNEELSRDTLVHHLKENIDHYKNGKWDSSIGQARNFVEQLLEDVARFIASGREEDPNLGKPILVRDYLQKIGFFGNTERRKLVDGIYGYFSEKGSHPGISEQSTARVSRNMMLSFGFYVLEKLENWKRGNK